MECLWTVLVVVEPYVPSITRRTFYRLHSQHINKTTFKCVKSLENAEYAKIKFTTHCAMYGRKATFSSNAFDFTWMFNGNWIECCCCCWVRKCQLQTNFSVLFPSFLSFIFYVSYLLWVRSFYALIFQQERIFRHELFHLNDTNKNNDFYKIYLFVPWRCAWGW